MKLADVTDPFMLKPSLTADGKPWVQRCYVCTKAVNFLKGDLYVRVEPLVRHKKCTPPPIVAIKKQEASQ